MVLYSNPLTFKNPDLTFIIDSTSKLSKANDSQHQIYVVHYAYLAMRIYKTHSEMYCQLNIITNFIIPVMHADTASYYLYLEIENRATLNKTLAQD